MAFLDGALMLVDFPYHSIISPELCRGRSYSRFSNFFLTSRLSVSPFSVYPRGFPCAQLTSVGVHTQVRRLIPIVLLALGKGGVHSVPSMFYQLD